MKAAWLVFPAWRDPRRKNKSFDGVSNIGAYMLMDVARRGGIEIDFRSVDSAREFDTVLVSLTSNYDMLSFYKTVRRHLDWQRGRRRFRVLCGGFGMQNPFPVADFVDEFWFGRCEDHFVQWLTTPDFEHESLMRPDRPKVCPIHQVPQLYPHKFRLNTGILGHDDFSEKIMGCPNKCFFCHFSFARKHIKTSDHYNLNEYNRGSQELDMFNLQDINPHCGKITIGLDGVSERLRRLVNKPISDDLLKQSVVHISNTTKITGKAVFLTLYCITGYETETDDEFDTLMELFRTLPPLLKKKMIVTLHFTPLHPSPATPMAYAAVNLHTTLNNRRSELVFDDDDKLSVYLRRYSESNWNQFESVIVERFTEQYRPLLDLVCFNSKFNALKSGDKLKYVEDHFDIGDLVRAYDPDEQLPSWVCESYMGQDTIRKMRRFMLRKMEGQRNG